jgi:hypothetical protein
MMSTHRVSPLLPSFDGAPRVGASFLGVSLLLGGCAWFSPSTTATIDIVNPDGSSLKATYTSAKDQAFLLQRDPETGLVQSVQVTSAASPVVDANSAMLGEAIGAGVAAGLKVARP